MKDRRGSIIDRRSGKDRRQAYDLDYLLKGGLERRKGKERRSEVERRAEWVRVGKWFSIYPWTKLRFQRPSVEAVRQHH